MADDPTQRKMMIVDILKNKSVLKTKVFDNTAEAFMMVKEILKNLSREVNLNLSDVDQRIRMEYTDRSTFDAQLRVAADMLLFSMHSNVFQFDREHPAWKTAYIQKNKYNAYSGIIHIYNFLADSFKYSRLDDLGYLIARIFINHENQYFVEGKRQMGMLFTNYGNEEFSKEFTSENCLHGHKLLPGVRSVGAAVRYNKDRFGGSGRVKNTAFKTDYRKKTRISV